MAKLTKAEILKNILKMEEQLELNIEWLEDCQPHQVEILQHNIQRDEKLIQVNQQMVLDFN